MVDKYYVYVIFASVQHMDINYTSITDCPYYLITRLSLSITTALKKGFAERGIGQVRPAYLGVLMSLWAGESLDQSLGKFGYEEGMKTNELGRFAGLEPSTMTGLIDRMEKDGLVKRADDPNDRRVQRVHLTDFGWKVRETVSAVLSDTLDEVFDGIPEKNIGTTRDVLLKALLNTNKVSAQWMKTER